VTKKLRIAIAGACNVGQYVARDLFTRGNEVTLIEQNNDLVESLRSDLAVNWVTGDACELYTLDAAVLSSCDVVVAATGDDEDNLVISQLAQERYGVPKIVARVNDPRNELLFDLLGVTPTVSATSMVMALIEHEVPRHELVHLLQLRKENLEIVEIEVGEGAPADGKRVDQLRVPESARLISVMRNGHTEIAVGGTELHAGDQVLAVLEPGKERELRRLLLADQR
jgi:trk system potassium uptake protein